MKKITYNDPKKFVLITFLLLLLPIAYNLIPIVENDLYRYYLWSDSYAQLEFNDFWESTELNDKLINSFFWIIGKIQLKGMIPLTTVLIVYGIGFWILNDVSNRLKINNKIFLHYFFFLIALLQFDSIASNVRNVIAFAVIALAVYRDLFLKRKNLITLILYIIPCGIHITSLIFILARIGLVIYKKLRLPCICILVTTPLLVKLVYGLLNSIKEIPFITQLVKKAYYYFFSFSTTEWGMQVQKSGFEQTKKMIYVFVFLILFCLCFSTYNFLRKRIPQYNDILLYIELSIVLTFMSLYIVTPAYFRFSIVVLILFPIVFFLAIKYQIQKRCIMTLMYSGYFLVVAYGFIAQAYHFYFNFRL